MSSPAYRIVWLHAVRSVWLGHLLLDLSARRESSEPLFQAVDRVNAKLARNPDRKGESRGEENRVLHVPPLTVTYEVHRDEQLVIVVKAHYAPRTGGPSA
jgi:hypothetical protein